MGGPVPYTAGVLTRRDRDAHRGGGPGGSRDGTDAAVSREPRPPAAPDAGSSRRDRGLDPQRRPALQTAGS